jgi:hypothetical protein
MASNPHGFFLDDLDGIVPRRNPDVETVAPLRAVRVVCIGATGQSGSTLLSRMMGSLPGSVAVGKRSVASGTKD